MKILVTNRGDASTYYRSIAPFSVLHLCEELDVTFTNILHPEAAEQYDVLWLQMDVGSDIEVVVHAFQQQGKRVIYDVDDWLFAYPPSWANHDAYIQRGIGQPTALLHSHARLLAAADVVTTTTEYLAAKLQVHNQHVAVLPNCIVQGDWDTLLPTHHNLDGLVVGWFGTGNHWEEWYELAPALDEALESIGGYLALIGAPEMLACFPQRLAARTYWTPLVPIRAFEQVRRTIQSFDIGLAWATERLETARCRSPLKALQYGAAGVPVFASTTVYDEVLREGYGFTFATPHKLADTLIQMFNDSTRWAEMQLRAAEWQRRVWETHTYETQAWRWLEVLDL